MDSQYTHGEHYRLLHNSKRVERVKASLYESEFTDEEMGMQPKGSF